MATPEDDARRRLVADLERRGFAAGGISRWGKPIWRRIEAGHEPQALMAASARQRRLVQLAHATPAPGDGLCASWVEQAHSRLGLGVVLGDARTLLDAYCHHTDTAELKVGMIVATAAHPYTTFGLAHGHVGLYVGRDEVMDATGDRVRHVPLELWLSAYGVMCDPRWGWLGSIGLS